MKLIVVALALIATTINASFPYYNTQPTKADFEKHSAIALELFALNHGLDPENCLPQISQFLFGKATAGYIFLTKKLMHQACKNTFTQAASPLVFYAKALREFNAYIEVSPTENYTFKAHTPNKQKSFRNMNVPPTYFIITMAILFVVIALNQVNLQNEVEQLTETTKTLRSQIEKIHSKLEKQRMQSSLEEPGAGRTTPSQERAETSQQSGFRASLKKWFYSFWVS